MERNVALVRTWGSRKQNDLSGSINIWLLRSPACRYFLREEEIQLVLLNSIEVVRGAFPSPEEVGTEALITNLVLWLKLAIELVGIVLIGMGVVAAIIRVIGVIRSQQLAAYTKARLVLSRYLALGLEFQLAADIIGTAVAPSWTQIGKLAAIAAIRTGLNYFLAREIREGLKEMNGLTAGAE
jgi:uncharacterized membrane protein